MAMSRRRSKKKNQANAAEAAKVIQEAQNAVEAEIRDQTEQSDSSAVPPENTKTPEPAENIAVEAKEENNKTEENAVSEPETDHAKAEPTAQFEQKKPAVTVIPARVRKKAEPSDPQTTDPYGNPIPQTKRSEPMRKKEPVQLVTPADIKKPQVSFMNSIANIEPEAMPHRAKSVPATAQAYDHAVLRQGGADDPDSAYRPKIRRMSDSTRAKELRRRHSSGESLPYMKDSPDHTPKTLPASKLRSKREQPVSQEVLARIPEQLKAHPLDDPQPVDYIGKAQHTQINLSADNRAVQEDINIDVRYHNERRERTDLPKKARDYSQSEDNAAIRNELTELKTNLSLRVAILGLLTALSALLMLFDWIPKLPMPAVFSSQHSPIAFLTVQLLLGLAALPFCGNLLKNGYLKLLTLHADCDSLAAMTMMSAEIAAFLILPSPDMLRSGTVSVYIPIGLLAVFLNAVGRSLIVSRALRNFERLADGNPKYGIHYVEDEVRAENLTRGTTGDFPILAAMQAVEQPGDFLKYTFSTDIADKFCRTAVPLMTLISLAFSVAMAVIRAGQVESAVCYGMSIFALCFAACACVAITLISNLPMAAGTKDYVRNSGLLLGYQSVDDFFDVNTVMVDAQTLFPRGTTKLESIQVIGESRIEEAVLYSASLTHHAGSILKDLFASAIVTEEQNLLPVENYTYDDGKGISGWIRNKRVLLGTRDMMIEHSIEGLPATVKIEALMPADTDVLYLSVAGSVAALYFVRLEASKAVRHWLRVLERENLFLLIRNNDALLSQRRISRMFGISEGIIKILPSRLEADYAAETKPLREAKPSMLCAGRLAGFIQTIIGAKRIRNAAARGLIAQTVSACIGLIYVLLFILLGAYKDISGGILLIFHLICTVATIIAVRMKDT